MILEIKNLSVTYPKVKALDNVSFSLAKGEVLGIVGESGSGKSTFAYSTLGLLADSAKRSGEIIFNSQRLLMLDDKKFQAIRGNKIGLIMQEPASGFNPVLTIGYHFHELLIQKTDAKSLKERNKIILDCFSMVHLPQGERMLKSYPHQLSGGQLQRASIAMAISLKPDILIADEPTSSLDVTIESQIINLFKELSGNLNIAVVFITHNLNLVKALCQRAVVLCSGQVKEIAEIDTLFAEPKDDYTKSLLAAFKETNE
ncbi:MAG: ABC transporter ATP-binding protein [Candidatus Omnitrophica bacterium]|nr:ABC transporter ATP-binding protein [Candidatus Omnitrophota bacterium]